MKDKIEIWGQDSNIKGTRLVKFKRLDEYRLQWLGLIDDIEKEGFIYTESELVSNKWKKC